MELWQRFTTRARRVVVSAHSEALSLGDPLIRSEHLLMGILGLGEGCAIEALRAAAVDLEALSADVQKHLAKTSQGEALTQGDLSFTPEAQHVLQAAYSESKRLKDSHVGTEHLLIGLVQSGSGPASRLLRRHGLTVTRARQIVTKLAAESAPPAAAPRVELRPEGVTEVLDRGPAWARVYDFHMHTFLSDGVLSPIELIRRAIVKGYAALGLADHVGAATMERVIREGGRDCELAVRYWNFRAFAGVELTHVPAASIAELAQEAKALGATHVVVHGESPVEPVEPGTNLAAVKCPDVDILGHPGLLTAEEARIAAETGVFIEITAKDGHSLGNGRVYGLARAAGALCVLDSDAHVPDQILTPTFARTVALGAGVPDDELELDTVLRENPEKLVARIMERMG